MSIHGDSELTATESIVVKIWEKELLVSGLDPSSNFFQLGGDSLQMLSMLFQIKVALGVEVHPGALFENPTVRAFSSVVELTADKERGAWDVPQSTVVEGSL